MSHKIRPFTAEVRDGIAAKAGDDDPALVMLEVWKHVLAEVGIVWQELENGSLDPSDYRISYADAEWALGEMRRRSAAPSQGAAMLLWLNKGPGAYDGDYAEGVEA